MIFYLDTLQAANYNAQNLAHEKSCEDLLHVYLWCKYVPNKIYSSMFSCWSYITWYLTIPTKIILWFRSHYWHISHMFKTDVILSNIFSAQVQIFGFLYHFFCVVLNMWCFASNGLHVLWVRQIRNVEDLVRYLVDLVEVGC